VKGQYHAQRSPPVIPVMTPTNPIQTSHLILLTDLYIIFQSMWNSTVTVGTWLWAGRLGHKSWQEQKNSCPKHPDWLQSISPPHPTPRCLLGMSWENFTFITHLHMSHRRPLSCRSSNQNFYTVLISHVHATMLILFYLR